MQQVDTKKIAMHDTEPLLNRPRVSFRRLPSAACRRYCRRTPSDSRQLGDTPAQAKKHPVLEMDTITERYDPDLAVAPVRLQLDGSLMSISACIDC